MGVSGAGWCSEVIALTQPHANRLKQGDFVARCSGLDSFELQLILLPQTERAVAVINASLNRGKIFLLHGMCIRRNHGKW